MIELRRLQVSRREAELLLSPRTLREMAFTSARFNGCEVRQGTPHGLTVVVKYNRSDRVTCQLMGTSSLLRTAASRLRQIRNAPERPVFMRLLVSGPQ